MIAQGATFDVCSEKSNYCNFRTDSTGQAACILRKAQQKVMITRLTLCTISKPHQEYIVCTYLCKRKQKGINDSVEHVNSVVIKCIPGHQNTYCKINHNLSTQILVCTDSN